MERGPNDVPLHTVQCPRARRAAHTVRTKKPRLAGHMSSSSGLSSSRTTSGPKLPRDSCSDDACSTPRETIRKM
eukprot:4183084-Prymnesium_polylepis.3